MHISKFEEPELEFGTSSHIDIRFGLMNYSPLDVLSDTAPKRINVGLVGSAESIEGVREWLLRCRGEIPAKKSRQPNLFPRFPGFNSECAFHSELVFDSAIERQVSASQISAISRIPLADELVIEAVRAMVDSVRFILEKRAPHVIVCAVPREILDAIEPRMPEADLTADSDGIVEETPLTRLDFHDLMKARCMVLPRACPIQLVLPSTYDPRQRGRGRSPAARTRPLQDEATRAWNMLTALYYKAGGTPWRLKQDASKLQTCFVGIGFFNTLDREKICSSVAQVFNERGNGVVVRGGPATISKEDRQVHLDAEGAYRLMLNAMTQFEAEHYTRPARVVVHKTSSHSADELDGFRRAVAEYRVHSCECLSVRKSFIRLFRNAEYPPLRGTFLTLDRRSHILYTRGSVDFYSTYPGMYMPRSLMLQVDQAEQTPKFLAEEVLALTKMNWNDTQFDGGVPITIRAARQVGEILKYAAITDTLNPHYSYYM